MIKPIVEVSGDLTQDIVGAIAARLKGIESAYVTIGVHEGAGKYTEGNDPPSVVEVALWNEFGTQPKGNHPGIDERSFLRSAINENEGLINKWRVEALNHILHDGWDVESALKRIGVRVQFLIWNKMDSDIPPPNAPSTIDRWLREHGVSAENREGKTKKTLYDTGLLRRSITYQVFPGGK